MGQGKRAAIIGGGISGCSLAYFLSRRGYRVTLFERQPTLGGLAGSFLVDGVWIDRFYHHFYTCDGEIIRLAEQLGLGERILWRKTRAGAYCRERMYDLSSPLSLLRFRALPLLDRLRLGWLIWSAQQERDWRPLEEIGSRDWVVRRAGERVYETLWGPLLRGKFGPAAERISAAWLWSKFTKRGGSRGRSGRERLGYLQGGLHLLFDRLEEEIRAHGGQILTGQTATALRQRGRELELYLADGASAAFDAIYSTLPAPEMLALLPADFPPVQRERLAGIEYLGAQCLILKLRCPLSGIYWINNTDPTIPFLGVIEHTNMVESAHYNGFHYVYLPRYLPAQHPDFRRDTEALYRAYLPALQRLFPDFREDGVVERYSWSDPYGQPIVKVGYGREIPGHVTGWPGLYYLSMCQIFPDDRQMSNAVKMAEKVAQRFA